MSEDSAVQSNAESMQEKPCSSSCTGDTPGAVMEEAKQLLGTGNRHLVMGDVVSAVAVFQEACGMLAKEYGDTADECGEAFFLCGKSLLELARMENTVLGNALDGVPEEETEDGEKPDDSKIESADNLDEETRDDLRVQVYDAMAEKEGEKSEAEKGERKSEDEVMQDENVDQSPDEEGAGELPQQGAENGSPPEQQGAENGSPPKQQGAEETTYGKSATVQNSEGSEIKEGEETADEEMEEGGEEEGEDDDDGEGATEDKDSDEEEVGNLQLAWEMLEVAKVIYKRKGNKDDQLLAAQTHLKLGEVSAESGNYSQALEDFQECLGLQLKSLPSHSRLLAETHYQLGLTFGYTGQYSLAIQHFGSSVEVIESRLVMLQEAIDEAEAGGATEERREMEELKQLLPDIQEKVEDAEESRKTAVDASVVIQQTLSAGSSGLPAESEGTSPDVSMPADGVSSSSVSDISHLVRKKRKPEESPLKDSDSKKSKWETAVNGGDASVPSEVQETAESPEESVKPANPMETSV